MKSSLPLISVIIPSYNKGKLILGTVDSVKNSAYAGPLEIIIIDDYSTDPVTKEAYRKIKKEYPDVCIEESGGKGPGNARNKGVSLAKGEYFLFLDSDDLISPAFMSVAYACLKEQVETCAYVYGDTVVFGGTVAWRPTPEFSAERIRISNYVPVTCLYRQQPVRESGGMSTELSAMEDWDLFLTLLDKGYNGAKIPSEEGAWLFYRQADQQGVNASVTTPKQRMILRTTILKRHGLPSRLVWNLAAVVYSWLKPLVTKRERDRFRQLPPEQQAAMQAIIQRSKEVR